MKIATKSIFTAVVAITAITWCGQLGAQSLAPQFTLRSAAATEVQAEENYVMQQPAASYGVPFRSTIGASAYAAAKQAAAANYSPLALRSAMNGPAPAVPPNLIVSNFNGAADVDGLRPPDTHGAVGPKNFVEVTNSHYNVFKKGTQALAKSVTLATFFNYSVKTLFDPRVVYDSTWQRWIVTAEAFAEDSTHQFFFIGISQTTSPLQGFFIYKVNVTFFTGDFWDFPQVGFDQDAVIFTANIFDSSDVFKGADAFAVAKARLYNGLSFSVPVFTGLVGTLAPPIVLDQNANTFLIAAPTSGTTLTKYTMTNSSHPGSTALGTSSVTVPSYTVPPDATQSGTTDKLDTSDSRFVNASTQKGTDLWQVHSIAFGAAACRFYRINTSNNTVPQSGTFFKSGTSADFNVSITANAAGDAFVTWTSTDGGAGINARVVAGGKQNADASISGSAGLIGFTSTTFYNPSGSTVERWGDYSAVTVDPTNSSRAWLVNEKINPNSVNWGTQIMQFGFL